MQNAAVNQLIKTIQAAIFLRSILLNHSSRFYRRTFFACVRDHFLSSCKVEIHVTKTSKYWVFRPLLEWLSQLSASHVKKFWRSI